MNLECRQKMMDGEFASCGSTLKLNEPLKKFEAILGDEYIISILETKFYNQNFASKVIQA